MKPFYGTVLYAQIQKNMFTAILKTRILNNMVSKIQNADLIIYSLSIIWLIEYFKILSRSIYTKSSFLNSYVYCILLNEIAYSKKLIILSK